MKDSIIKVKDVDFEYKTQSYDEKRVRAVSGINLHINTSQFVVVLGRNGSGKSTFARLLNALLLPDKGAIYIKDMITEQEEYLWEIRRTAGMVFQNPDNQIVGTVVEEDIAFGPENIGVPPEEIRERVDNAMEIVGISEYAKRAPHLLSGGQKQRVAIAGILAMKPECIILDEATSMLDPIGRKEVIQILKELNKQGITIVHITHHMDEAAEADRVIVMDEGSVVMDGVPEKVFSNVETIKELGLDVPQVTELFYELNSCGCSLPTGVLTVDGAAEALMKAVDECREC